MILQTHACLQKECDKDRAIVSNKILIQCTVFVLDTDVFFMDVHAGTIKSLARLSTGNADECVVSRAFCKRILGTRMLVRPNAVGLTNGGDDCCVLKTAAGGSTV